MNYVIDRMHSRDWEHVRSIYLEGIAGGHSTFETSAPSWETWDEAHLQIARLVMRDGDKILGWAALSPVSKRNVYRGVAELLYTSQRAQEGRALVALYSTLSSTNQSGMESGRFRQLYSPKTLQA